MEYSEYSYDNTGVGSRFSKLYRRAIELRLCKVCVNISACMCCRSLIVIISVIIFIAPDKVKYNFLT